MKTFILALVILSATSAAQAVPVLAEKNYTNYAWGYVNRGCFVDESGFVYTYDSSSDNSMQKVSQISKQHVERITELASRVVTLQFNRRRAAADAGSTVWTVNYYGETTALKETGDFEGQLQTQDAMDLLGLIDQVCP